MMWAKCMYTFILMCVHTCALMHRKRIHETMVTSTQVQAVSPHDGVLTPFTLLPNRVLYDSSLSVNMCYFKTQVI